MAVDKAMNVFLDCSLEGPVVGVEEFRRGRLEDSWECVDDMKIGNVKEKQGHNRASGSNEAITCQSVNEILLSDESQSLVLCHLQQRWIAAASRGITPNGKHKVM